MKFALIFDIARSLMLARFRQTLIAAIGVTFSITMFIALLGFMNGLNSLLDGLILNRTPHIRLYNEIKPNEKQPLLLSEEFRNSYPFIHSIKPSGGRIEIHNALAIMAELKKDNRILGVSPKIVSQVFFNSGSVDITGVINGVDIDQETRLYAFNDYVIDGKSSDLKLVPNSIILGKAAAQTMMLNIGDLVQVTTPTGERMQLKIVAFFQSGLQELDKTQSYASISTTQKLMGKSNNYISEIQIKLHDMNKAPALAKQFAEIFNVQATDIQTANSQFETGSSVRSIISYAVGITLLIVAGFGIYNILNMMIYEKLDTIAILKATGFSGKDVNRIFITIALTIGIFGAVFGLLLGYLSSYGIDQIPFETEALPTIKTYPVAYNISFYVIGGVFALVTTYLAGFFPARKAGRVDPVVIIRGK
ncbi:MAG TPA: FtsX-like permease family protein [Flavobacteriales bacterium]|nr:FtsX-like permease family protein [Flavobacteriales bacterium]HRE97537.1 FtsX-like permease family protein [Flavobacteriales bacterium]HRJ36238.1 FtsX-like permease family protein [Flavobacteriales bacterium]HRJ39447.1 FtsX-like permease family protein [Flavobacteriales bacterium]